MYILRNKNFAAQYYYPQSYADYSRYYDRPKDSDEGLNKAIKAGAIGTVGAGALAAGAGAYGSNLNTLRRMSRHIGEAGSVSINPSGVFDTVKNIANSKEGKKIIDESAKNHKRIAQLRNAINNISKSKSAFKQGLKDWGLGNVVSVAKEEGEKGAKEAAKHVPPITMRIDKEAAMRVPERLSNVIKSAVAARKISKVSKKAAIAGGIGTLGLGAIKLAKDSGRKGNNNKK